MDENTSRNDGRGHRFPKPDRSDQQRNFVKTADDDALDIGWAEGELTDGRPYRAEAWAEDQITMLTFFWSTIGMENASNDDLANTLVHEGLLRFTSEKHFVAARPFVDAAGNEMWSVNVVVGDDEQTFVDDNIRLNPYPKP